MMVTSLCSHHRRVDRSLVTMVTSLCSHHRRVDRSLVTMVTSLCFTIEGLTGPW